MKNEESDNERMPERRVVSRILGNITHELKTPLHSILALAQLLDSEVDGGLNGEQKKQVGMILRNGEALLELITQMLNFSSLESGAQQAAFEEFSPEQILRDMIETIGPIADRFGIEVDADFSRVSGQMVSDQRLVRQCLSNLLGNALKFAPTGTQLSVHASTLHDRSIRIDIADSGAGIPFEAKSLLFNEFFQAENTDNRKFGGAGLGLALVKTALELLGGEIQVRSELGQGSLFSVTIPSREDRLVRPQIFIIDSDQNVELTLRTCFEREGWLASAYADVESAAHDARNEQPRLVVIGNSEPSQENVESFADTIRRFRSLSRSELNDSLPAPVLALSTYDDARLRKSVTEAGASDCLKKPFQLDDLLARARALLAIGINNNG